MKKFSEFIIFFILLVSGLCGLVCLTIDMSYIFQYFRAINDMAKAEILPSIIDYSIATVSFIIGGSFISVFLYQIKRIADNTEK